MTQKSNNSKKSDEANKKERITSNQSKKQQKPKKGSPSPNRFWLQMLAVVIILAAVMISGSFLGQSDEDDGTLSLSELSRLVTDGQVESIVVRGETLEVLLIDQEEDADPKLAKKEREASLSETLVNYGVEATDLAEVDIEVKNENSIGYYIGLILPFLFPLLFIGLLIWFFAGQLKGSGMKAFSFGQSKAKIVDPKDQKIRFKDVAGVEEAKNELLEVVDFLKYPEKFLAIGAKIPKGVLLMGAPGTGKTLLARAVAGEAQVPFFHLSGSDFVEMFVGVGASRVRDLFAMAKKAAPAIIFIDEIDAVGRSRGTGVGGGNDEREQTLNQILVEMDGFEPSEQLIVMAATNRKDVLDPALLRPGRFDRRVHLDMPDKKGRKLILTIHSNNKPLADDVDLQVIATRTPGFSGADLESLMNEAAILAARRDQKKVTQKDILESIEKVMIGPERKSHLHTEHERKVVAYHEAGHALVASVLPNADPVHKVSIVARGQAGGYTLKLPDEEKKLKTRGEFIDDLAMTLGGYVTEKMVFGDITTGPSNDLQVVTKTARNMVTRWGMSDEFGPIALEDASGIIMRQGNHGNGEYSQEVASQIDSEVRKLVHTARTTAEEVVTKHRKALDAIAEALLEKEILERDAYEAIIKDHGIEVPEKKD